MKLRLVVVEGVATGLHVGLEGRSAFTVGSSPTADLTLRDPELAAVHLRFQRGPGGFTVVDLSKRGFVCRGQRVSRATLDVGDTVQAGGHTLKLICDDRRIERHAPPPPPPAPLPNAGACLEVLEGNDTGRRFDLAHGRPAQIMGRGSQCDITLWDLRASRAHCRLDRQDACWLVSDLNSSNGTYVNGTRLKSTHLLRNGDLIQIGSTVLRYQG